jgi:osmotically-inducible protein OsmY
MFTERGAAIGEAASTVSETAAAQTAVARLQASPCVALHELSCRCANGVMEIRGTVPTQYAKRLALACVACLEGVQIVIDSIGVQFPGA